MVPVFTVLLLAVLFAGFARAAPNVFFSPSHVVLEPGETETISFRVDDCGDLISGYKLYLSFDPMIVELTTVTEGSLYVHSGHPTWFISEEEAPGQWHFFDTVMGTGTYVSPPGELLSLEFTALNHGTAEVHIDTILLADIERNNLPVGSYEHGYIFVVPPTGVEEGGGTAQLGPAYPNPFVSDTAVPFFAPMDGGGSRVEIYDVRGRLIRHIPVPRGALQGELLWDGRDERGEEVPSSVYFLRMIARTSTAHCRLVKAE